MIKYYHVTSIEAAAAAAANKHQKLHQQYKEKSQPRQANECILNTAIYLWKGFYCQLITNLDSAAIHASDYMYDSTSNRLQGS